MPVEHLEWAVADLKNRAEAYRRHERYYDGDHDLTFATEKFRSAFGTLFRTFADNLCPPVVDALVDRLQIRSLGTSERAQAIAATNRLPKLAGEVHLDAARLGDAFVIVWHDRTGTARFYPNRPNLVTVAYDEEDDPNRVLMGAKVWQGRDFRWRSTLYYPDHLERYEARAERSDAESEAPAKGGGWQPRIDEFTAEGADGILPNQFGEVPVFHFGNNAPTGGFGRSELHNVIPVQNALNKSVADTLVGAEFQALPQRYATGVQVLRDPVTGEQADDEFRAGPDRLWWTANDKAAFGQFSAGDIAQLVALSESFRLEIARISGTPVHYFTLTGTPPSGLSLQVLDGRLNKKAEDRQLAFGERWAAAMDFGLRLDSAPPEPVECQWEPAAIRDLDAELARAEAKLRIGVSRAQVLRELGYTDEELEAMDDERDLEGDAFGAAALAAFDGARPVTTAQGAAMAGAALETGGQ